MDIDTVFEKLNIFFCFLAAISCLTSLVLFILGSNNDIVFYLQAGGIMSIGIALILMVIWDFIS